MKKSMTDTVVERLRVAMRPEAIGNQVFIISETLWFALNEMASDEELPEASTGYMDMEYTLVDLYAEAIKWPDEVGSDEAQQARINGLIKDTIACIMILYVDCMELTKEIVDIQLKRLKGASVFHIAEFLTKYFTWAAENTESTYKTGPLYELYLDIILEQLKPE